MSASDSAKTVAIVGAVAVGGYIIWRFVLKLLNFVQDLIDRASGAVSTVVGGAQSAVVGGIDVVRGGYTFHPAYATYDMVVHMRHNVSPDPTFAFPTILSTHDPEVASKTATIVASVAMDADKRGITAQKWAEWRTASRADFKAGWKFFTKGVSAERIAKGAAVMAGREGDPAFIAKCLAVARAFS